MAELYGNLLVAQSGGPTSVINASIAGVITEAGKHDEIENILGGLNGILGILNEDLVDLGDERAKTIDGLRNTPAAALGTCRYKINFEKKPEQAVRDMDRLFQVFEAHNIRYFFYAGGNDSQDTAHKIHLQAVQRGYEMKVMGVPKTIDNDLPCTDHCPGYGSVVKYNATTVMEVGLDVGSMATDDGSCCIIEVMGRAAGWIAAGTVLAKQGNPALAPHLILVPEIHLDEARFLEQVKATVAAYKFCVVVTGEGVKNQAGEEIGADKTRLDAFGHPVLSGAADALAQMVQGRLNLKTRTVKLGYAQRAAAHFASQTDIDEAFLCGSTAVKEAIQGKSGFMPKIVRISSKPYKYTVELEDLANIANVEHFVPRDWIDADGFMPNDKFIEYVAPLVMGEPKLPMVNGLPNYVTLSRVPVDKLLPPR